MGHNKAGVAAGARAVVGSVDIRSVVEHAASSCTIICLCPLSAGLGLA